MIRPATTDDAEAIWKLVCILEDTELDRAAFFRTYAAQQADGRHVTLVWCDEEAESANSAPEAAGPEAATAAAEGNPAAADADTAGSAPATAPIRALMNMRIEEQLHHAALIAEVQELVVDPALRSRRVGAQLLAAARQAAQDAGCVRIELVTNQRRHDAHRFYEREGMAQSHFGYTFDL